MCRSGQNVTLNVRVTRGSPERKSVHNAGNAANSQTFICEKVTRGFRISENERDCEIRAKVHAANREIINESDNRADHLRSFGR